MVGKVYVVGMGMGNPGTLTQDAVAALAASDLLVGSERLLAALGGFPAHKVAAVSAARIGEVLRGSDAAVASVVMSGDIGFYSGAGPVYAQLEGMDVTTVPGVSSLAYLCSRLRVPWQDVHVVSVHGRAGDVCGAVQSHARTFVLLGGRRTAAAVCEELAGRGLGHVRVWVGERLSYEDERVVAGSAAELAGGSFAPLSVMLVENDRPLSPRGALPHLPDEAFERTGVPMTKREVRELALCRLHVCADDTVWDVGAGTGSVTVEAACAAYAGFVCAVERRGEALDLLARNVDSFGLPNVRIVAGEAPEALRGLPTPDCVFVGGTGGRLPQILDGVYAANGGARVCVSAVTLETLAQALECLGRLGIPDVDVCQVGVARACEAGSHHIMRAQNPVYLISVGCGYGKYAGTAGDGGARG